LESKAVIYDDDDDDDDYYYYFFSHMRQIDSSLKGD